MADQLTQLSDEDLMTLYQTGDMQAFETLYRRHSERVLAYLCKKTSEQNARDLLQDTFLKLHRARHQYSSQYPFLPWLFAITRNALVDLVRSKEMRISRESASQVETLAASEDLNWVPDLLHALQTLPANQRRAIELRYQSDWTFEQIAKEMETTPVNIRQMISRGIKKLRGIHE